MCQMSVVLEHDGTQENIMDNVTLLELTAEGIKVSTFFEEPKLVPAVQVKKIDFLGRVVTLGRPKGEKP